MNNIASDRMWIRLMYRQVNAETASANKEVSVGKYSLIDLQYKSPRFTACTSQLSSKK